MLNSFLGMRATYGWSFDSPPRHRKLGHDARSTGRASSASSFLARGQPAPNWLLRSLSHGDGACRRRPHDVAARLGDTGYLCDDALATVTFLALRMQRPLLLEGEPGTGKTALAEAIAESLDLPLVRLQCYEGIDATQALYDWDFPRQILHLRALEAAGGGTDVEEAEKSLYDERFLLARPVLAALQQSPAVLLVDEVDRADDEFEAFLLEVLSTYQVSIPELGTVAAATPPVVVLTSNRTRELHDALKRRCLYHWIDHPGLEREVQIVRTRAPEVSEELARQVVGVVQQLRDVGLQKPPGRRRDPRLGPRAAPPRHHHARPGVVGADAGRAGEVPRGRAAGAAGARPDAAGLSRHDRDRPTVQREPDEILLGFARALRAAGVPVTHDRTQGYLAAVALVGLDDAAATYVAGRATLCASPDDLARYDQVYEAYFNARDGLPAVAAGRGGRARPSPGCRCPRPTAPERRAQRRPGGAGDGQRRRGAAPPRRGLAVGGGEGPAGRDVRDAAAAPAAPAYVAAPALAPRHHRRLAHPAGQPAPHRASPRRSPGGAAGTSRAASSFWWTCPVR